MGVEQIFPGCLNTILELSQDYGRNIFQIFWLGQTKNQDLKKCYHFSLVPWATNEITHEQIQGLYLTVKTPNGDYCTLL